MDSSTVASSRRFSMARSQCARQEGPSRHASARAAFASASIPFVPSFFPPCRVSREKPDNEGLVASPVHETFSDLTGSDRANHHQRAPQAMARL
jgi:hypothetical protein